MANLDKKIDRAIRLLQSIPTDKGDIEVSYSGGKDSDVILELAKMAGIPYRAIYKNTTIDPPGTIKHAKDMGAEIVQPKMTFFQLIQNVGIPNRRRRICCSVLKEYALNPINVMGIRRSESVKRFKLYKEPEQCRVLHGIHQRSYLPILEWDNEDVEQFIVRQGVKCHPLYYDEQGFFHVERRLGCIACPLMSRKKRIANFKEYPKMLRAWIRNYQVYLDTHPEGKAFAFCHGSAYNGMFQELFTNTKEEYEFLISGGLLPETAIDAKTFLEDYFKIDFTI